MANQDTDTRTSGFTKTKLFSFLKSSRTDYQGIPIIKKGKSIFTQSAEQADCSVHVFFSLSDHSLIYSNYALAIHVTRSRNPIKTNTRCMDRSMTLYLCNNARYVGVDIATDLNFSQHVNRIKSNAMKSLGYLKRNIKTNHSGISDVVYKTIVRPQ